MPEKIMEEKGAVGQQLSKHVMQQQICTALCTLDILVVAKGK
jgi:hypothetical protein